jgi:hypothetical protein
MWLRAANLTKMRKPMGPDYQRRLTRDHYAGICRCIDSRATAIKDKRTPVEKGVYSKVSANLLEFVQDRERESQLVDYQTKICSWPQHLKMVTKFGSPTAENVRSRKKET